MTFSTEQVQLLSAPLSREHVKSRSQAGRSLSYVEGWHCVAEANRIFGFDKWDRETIEMREVRPAELVQLTRKDRQTGKDYTVEQWRVGFVARVRVTAGGIFRDGSGFGSGFAADLGDAYESAIKEAETDAMKRALMTFGNPFGLALYDKEQREVENQPKANGTAKLVTAAPPKDRITNDLIEKSLVDRIAVARTVEELDAAKKLPVFQAQFKKLPQEARARVISAGQYRRANLSVPL